MSLKLEGQAEVAAPPDQVFERLLDPEVLRECIPGCRSLEEVGEHEYDVVVQAGVGPVKGTFRGRVRLFDLVPPERYDMQVTGQSTVGHVDGAARIRLEPTLQGGTRIAYAGEAKVAGLLAQVGSRLLELAAAKVAEQFFERLAKACG